MSGQQTGYVSAEWTAQVSATLADLGRRLEQLERRVERLDTHSGELAQETLDIIGRVDALDVTLARTLGALGRHGEPAADAEDGG